MAWRIKETKEGEELLYFAYMQRDKIVRGVDPKVLGGQFAVENSKEKTIELSNNEIRYLEEVNEYIKRLNAYGIKKSNEIKKEINTLLNKVSKESNSFVKLERFFKEKAGVIHDAFIHEEESKQEARVNLRKELDRFRQENNITKREAYYPKSYILHFAWIFVFIFLEALVNAYFFGQASSLGLLGGVFIGFITSFFNVVLSTIAGFVLRYKNHVVQKTRRIGLAIFTLLLLLIFFIHLFIAHYRELLQSNPDVEIGAVLNPMIHSPFALHDMESLILVSIGVLVTLFSIIKGMKMDDKYPGYGVVYRQWKVSDNEFLDAKKQLRRLMRELYSVTIRKSDTLMENLESSKDKLEALALDLDSFITTYKLYYHKAFQTGREILVDYRLGVESVYGEDDSFNYKKILDEHLNTLNINMLLNTKLLIEKELKSINEQIDSFYENQEQFEQKLEEMKERYLENEYIEKVLQQIKKNREIEL